MTTAGEGTSYQGGGGPGGKFRKRPFRRTQTTPYDRPPTAIRNPRNGWLSRLVDPASKLISASAHMFFSSMFRKRLLPPPQPSLGANQESSDTLQVRKALVPNISLKNPPEPQESAVNDDHNPVNSYNNAGISELEQILKQKTFTRSEIDRLTELLRSRTADLPNIDVNKRIEANLPKMAMPLDKQEEITGSQMQENGIGSRRQHEFMSSPIVSSRVLKEDVASPAELAKAYMGSRSSKVSPSKSNLHGQVPREEGILLNDVSFPPKSSIISLAPESAFRAGVSESGFFTPRSRGRSAIYSMARTPYSRIYSTTNPKALKRGSSVLDDDIGSVGPIRRIRQKSELLSPKDLSLPVSGSPLSSHAIIGYGTKPPISSTQKPLLLEEPKHKFSKIVGEKEDNNICSTNFSLIPSKSTVMATKIFNHLEQMAPKGNSSESKLAAARDKSPTKLTPSMLSGKALKSLEHVDSSKFLHNALHHHKLEEPHNTSSPVVSGSTSKKQDSIEENSSKSLVIPRDMLAPVVSCGDTTVAIKDTVPTFRSGDSAPANVVAQPPQKKRAFQMSAHEDSLELDDDVHSNGDVSSLSAEGREKSDTSVVESKSIVAEAAVLEKPTILSKVEPPAGSELNKTTDLGTNDGSVAVGKSVTITLPTAPVSSSVLQPVSIAPQSVSTSNKISPQDEPNVPSPLFILSSKNIDNAPQFKFSPSASAAESSGLISSALLDPKPESSNCFPNVASGASDAISKNFESDKVDNKDSQEAGDMIAKSNIIQSTSTPTNSIFSFGVPANNPSQSNGSLASSPSIFSPSAPFIPSSSFSNNNWNNSSMHFTSSTNTATIYSNPTTSGITTASSGSSNTSVSAPLSSAAPIFSFSSSVAPSTSVSVAPPIFSSASSVAPSTSFSVAPPIFSIASSVAPSTSVSVATPIFRIASSVAPSTSVSAAPPIFSFTSSGAPFSSVSALSTSVVQDTNSKVNSEGTNSCNLTSSHIGDASSVVVSTESSIFGFSASAATSSVNNQSQGSPFGSTNGNPGDARAPPGVGVASVFGSSASSSIFGSTGSSFTSSTSPFGSSTAVAKPFSSFTNFNPSSAALETNSTSTSSGGGNSSLFGSSWPATKSSIFDASSSSSVFNYTSPSSSTGFSFGASSGFGAAPNNAPSMVFGSSTSASSGSIFSFNSAAANPPLASHTQTQPVFGNSNSIFTASAGNGDQMNMEDSMAEDTVQASTTPATPAFGQPSVLPPSRFGFGSSVTPGAHPFQFGGQQNQATLQNPPPFQASGSLELSAGGSFSLGSGGGDKSLRRIVKASRSKGRKK